MTIREMIKELESVAAHSPNGMDTKVYIAAKASPTMSAGALIGAAHLGMESSALVVESTAGGNGFACYIGGDHAGPIDPDIEVFL